MLSSIRSAELVSRPEFRVALSPDIGFDRDGELPNSIAVLRIREIQVVVMTVGFRLQQSPSAAFTLGKSYDARATREHVVAVTKSSFIHWKIFHERQQGDVTVG